MGGPELANLFGRVVIRPPGEVVPNHEGSQLDPVFRKGNPVDRHP
jgi:hypothetical protein